MELIFTSFGLSHLPLHVPFFRLPPFDLSTLKPDYTALLLCDQLIFDGESFERLSDKNISALSGYSQMAEVIKALHAEGFVRVEDFSAVVDENRELLETMLERDLKMLDLWAPPLKESIQIWQNFIEANDRSVVDRLLISTRTFSSKMEEMAYMDIKPHVISHFALEAIESATKRRRAEHRAALRDMLTQYMSYVNANLVLSRSLDAGFLDWSNFAPFYRNKFLMVGHEDRPEQKKIDQVKQLFEVSFPDLTFWDTKPLIKALTDKRIFELRDLVDKAAQGEVEFDREFATRTFQEVLGIERRLDRVRNIVSYATLPIGFIPWIGTPAQKGIDELVNRVGGG
jgi:hypothetical protein